MKGMSRNKIYQKKLYNRESSENATAGEYPRSWKNTPNLSPVEETVLGSYPVKITRKPCDLSSLIGK